MTFNGSSDSLGFLVPKYVKNPNVALCPSTDNYLRSGNINSNPTLFLDPSDALGEYNTADPILKDLLACAPNRGSFPGTSYEIFGWYDGIGIYPDGSCLNPTGEVRSRNQWLGLHPGDFFWSENNGDPAVPATMTGDAMTNSIPKRVGHFKNATATILVLDSDQDNGTTKPGINNWPDAHNNHGTAGLNIGFADGHVSWTARGPDLIRTYVASHNGTGVPLANATQFCPNLVVTAGTLGGSHKYSYK